MSGHVSVHSRGRRTIDARQPGSVAALEYNYFLGATSGVYGRTCVASPRVATERRFIGASGKGQV